MPDNATQNNEDPSELFAFADWLKSCGRSRTTGYRYRRLGIIDTKNVFGRLYVTRQEIKRFESRAASGEFSVIVKTPRRCES